MISLDYINLGKDCPFILALQSCISLEAIYPLLRATKYATGT